MIAAAAAIPTAALAVVFAPTAAVTLAPAAAAVAAVLATFGVADVVVLRRGRRPGARRGRAAVAPLARLGRVLGPRAPRSLPARIEAAGSDADAADVMAVKAGAAIVGLAAGAALAPAAPGRLAPVLLLALPVAAFLVPDAQLRRRTRARTRVLEAELANVLDLLAVALAAGLAPRRALAEIGRRHPGPLAAELRRAAARAVLGVPLDRALAELERRAPAHGVPALTAALARAHRHGAPLQETLAAQAAQARARATQRTLESAGRAAPQIQLVVALLLVPAVLLLVAAALLPALAGGRI